MTQSEQAKYQHVFSEPRQREVRYCITPGCEVREIRSLADGRWHPFTSGEKLEDLESALATAQAEVERLKASKAKEQAVGILDNKAYCDDCGKFGPVLSQCRNCASNHETKWQTKVNNLESALATAREGLERIHRLSPEYGDEGWHRVARDTLAKLPPSTPSA